jgi:glycosyltransferase involved in cell wall biosynthesis
MSLRILVIWRLLTVGGVNAGWRNRAQYFKQHGIEVDFLYNKNYGGLHMMQDVVRVYLTNNEDEIQSILTSNHYDAIIVVDTGGAYQWINRADYRGPVIIETRTPELLKLIPHLQRLEAVSPVAVVSPSHFERRLSSIFIHRVPMHVIYNGVDTSFFRPLDDDEIPVYEEPRLPHGKKVVGWVGRIDKRKNWRMMLHVARLIARERDDIEFWVIGGAESIEKDLFAAARHRLKMTELVKWFPVIPYQAMPSVYAKIRRSGGCTLATTKVESFGNTFIESMACGVPVVAPSVSSMTEVVVHGETGFLFRDQNDRDAIRKIYQLLDHPELYTRISSAAVQHVSRYFSIPVVGEEYIHLLRSITHVNPPRTEELMMND